MIKIFIILLITFLGNSPTYSQIFNLGNNNHLTRYQNLYVEKYAQRKGMPIILLNENNYSDEIISIKINLSHVDSAMYSREQYDRGTIRIIGEIAVGAGLGLVITVPPLVLYALSHTEGFGYHGNSTIPVTPVLALYSAYVLASSYGVYIIAEGGNKELSFLPTLGFATLGGVLASIPFLITKIKDPGIFIAGLAALPLIGSLVYANLIAPYPIINEDAFNNIYNSNSFLTHKDFYNKSILMNLKIIRIEF